MHCWILQTNVPPKYLQEHNSGTIPQIVDIVALSQKKIAFGLLLLSCLYALLKTLCAPIFLFNPD